MAGWPCIARAALEVAGRLRRKKQGMRGANRRSQIGCRSSCFPRRRKRLIACVASRAAENGSVRSARAARMADLGLSPVMRCGRGTVRRAYPAANLGQEQNQQRDDREIRTPGRSEPAAESEKSRGCVMFPLRRRAGLVREPHSPSITPSDCGRRLFAHNGFCKPRDQQSL